MNYIYGNQATNKQKSKKRERERTKNNNSSKRFAARKRGKRIFIARFPVVGPRTTMVPWLNGKNYPEKEGTKSQAVGVGKQPRRFILNGALSVNESTMNFLNSELESFSDYVRLSRHEIKAREHLIDKIKRCCKNLFGVEESQCQVFGSFAAQAVCIFESDIDLAIWGVVEPDDDEEEDNDDQDLTMERSAERTGPVVDADPNDKNRKKQERVLKWKALIDNATNNGENDEKLAERLSANPITETKTESDSIEPSLFVIDRTGDKSITLSDANGDCPLDDITLKSRSIDGVRKDCSNIESCDDDNSVDDNIASNCDSENESVNDDSADKLENFWSRQRDGIPAANDGIDRQNLLASSGPGNRDERNDSDYCNDDTENEEETIFNDGDFKRRPRGQSLVSLSSSTTCSVEAKLDESEMEVSFVVEGNKRTAREKLGPSGRTRTLVVRSLFKLTRPLRSFSSQIHVRSKARVPIINMLTNFGFECDIALGGHNGADTSSYASTQLSRFKSFSTLVVFLKILLGQQGLDKPFTGGIGSYSLYVLVASHLEHHLALGGDDKPAEVLYTFLFRYGAVQHSNPKISSSYRTLLSQESVIRTEDGGSVDLKPCFQIGNCITVFAACWRMLQNRLTKNCDGKFSILQFMIDAMKLEIGRSQSKKQAVIKPSKTFSHVTRSYDRTHRDEKKDQIVDNEARALIRGYGQKVETFLPVNENPKKKTTKKRKERKRQKCSS